MRAASSESLRIGSRPGSVYARFFNGESSSNASLKRSSALAPEATARVARQPCRQVSKSSERLPSRFRHLGPFGRIPGALMLPVGPIWSYQ